MIPFSSIYIAGPMRGYPDHNFPAFREAAARFQALGATVWSPVDLGQQYFKNNPDVPGGEYLRVDLAYVIKANGIALLPGWERSTGARCEVAVAVTIGLTFYDALTAAEIAAPERVTVCGGYERPAGAVDSLDQVRADAIAWANATFTQANPHSKAEHLRREAVELCADPSDVEEMADVFILLSHISDGYDLLGAARAKLEKNRRRVWGTPDAHGVVEHVAEGDGSTRGVAGQEVA